jgi:diguanylate cyclase (GGDEF)-like protein/PAS domain S-box-containing protein
MSGTTDRDGGRQAASRGKVAAGARKTAAPRAGELTAQGRVTRALEMVNAGNHALIRATDEQQLLTDICQAAVQTGGYPLVWVGYARDDRGKTVRPVAVAGVHQDYVAQVKASWADNQRGRGPTGTAIRTGQTIVGGDAASDPRMAPWRAAAARHGLHSSIAIPLNLDGKAFGALMVYAAELNAFDARESELLSNFAADLAYGVGVLRGRLAQQTAEAEIRRSAERYARSTHALQQSQEKFRNLVENSPDWIWEVDSKGAFTYSSPRAREFVDREPEDLIGRAFLDFMAPGEAARIGAVFRDVSERKASFSLLEQRMVGRSGREVIVEASGVPILNADGSLKGIQGMARDVTEARRLAHEASLQAAITSAIQETFPDGVLLVDERGRIRSFNRRFAELWKLLPEDIARGLDAPILRTVTSRMADPEAFLSRVNELYRNVDATSQDELVLRDGRTFDRYSAPVKLASGEYIGRVWFFRDITERKQAENNLSEARAALMEAQSVGQVGSWRFDIVHDRTDWSDECYRIYGVDRATFIGTFDRYLARVHPEDRDAFGAAYGQSLKDHIPVVLDQRIVLDDGTVRNVELRWQVYCDVDGAPQRLSGTVQDITARKASETALREERDFSAAVIDGTPGIYFVLDASGKNVRFNANLPNVLGLSAEKLMETSVLAVIQPGDRERVLAKLGEVVEHGEAEIELDVPNRKTGAVRSFHIWARRIRVAGKAGTLGVGVDVTEARAAEAARARLAAIVESSRDAIIGKALDGTITSWNLAAERMYGYGADEAVGQSIDLIVSQSRRNESEDILSTIARGERVEQYETERIRKDGTLIPVSVTVSPVRDAAGKVVGASSISRDITQQKQDAAALAYGDRLLHAVTHGTAALIDGATFESGMENALQIVGEAMGVDRVIVLREAPGQNPPLVLQHLWQAQDIGVRLDEAAFSRLTMPPAAARAWRDGLAEGKPVITQLASSRRPVRAVMEQIQNKSTLQIAIRVGGELWGNIGVDACKAERTWTASEIETLTIFAESIGSFIAHNHIQVELEQSEERFRVVSATAQDAIVMINSQGCISYWNQAAERILGYSAEEAVGKDIHDWLAPARFRQKAHEGMRAFAATGQGDAVGRNLELAAIRKDGVEIAIELSLASARLDDEWRAVGVLRDITERKQAEAKIVDMARNDSLTGLANRRAFVDELLQSISGAHRGGRGFAVFYLDLDHFKDINDTLGHPIGDQLLQAVAERLRRCIRGNDSIARFGGDEFAVIGADIDDATDAAILADKILKAIREPFAVGGNEIRSGTSVGIAMYGADSEDAETLLSYADLALYRAKSDGRGTYRFFTDAMDVEVRTRVTLGSELRMAIGAGQLFLAYQPQVDVETRRLVGLEALVRWNHPDRGVLGPGEFIHTAERTGLIVALGQWVVREACRQIRVWLDAGLEPPLVAVNLSGLQFKTPLELEKGIESALTENDLTPQRLELELTETVLMEASREHNDLLIRLRKRGLRLAIDDFGTGYSSLGYLQKFPVDRIKIAQDFMPNLGQVNGNIAIMKAIVSIARALKIDVIAEGVETEEQLQLLRTLGCRQVQGYYFSQPVTAEAIEPILRAGVIRGAPASSPT